MLLPKILQSGPDFAHEHLQAVGWLVTERLPYRRYVESFARALLWYQDVAADGAGVCVSSTSDKPFSDAFVAEYVLAWERNRLMSCAKVLSANVARIGWMEVCFEEVLHD